LSIEKPDKLFNATHEVRINRDGKKDHLYASVLFRVTSSCQPFPGGSAYDSILIDNKEFINVRVTTWGSLHHLEQHAYVANNAALRLRKMRCHACSRIFLKPRMLAANIGTTWPPSLNLNSDTLVRKASDKCDELFKGCIKTVTGSYDKCCLEIPTEGMFETDEGYNVDVTVDGKVVCSVRSPPLVKTSSQGGQDFNFTPTTGAAAQRPGIPVLWLPGQGHAVCAGCKPHGPQGALPGVHANVRHQDRKQAHRGGKHAVHNERISQDARFHKTLSTCRSTSWTRLR
jgi:hypothetical protein